MDRKTGTDQGREPAHAALLPGARLGPYEVVKLVGSGGMGEVYKAFDPRLDRHVALKVLTEKSLARGYRGRFIREAKATAALNHPNIAQIYEIAEEGATCYIAMEYVEGSTLRRKMNAPDGALPELLEYMLQVADALGKAHTTGVIHCDLKPENIMITPDGVAKVLDFGLAKLIERYRREAPEGEPLPSDSPTETEPAGGLAGTLGYMSPEQAGGKEEIDERSDVFSFGCILFEILARRRPFMGESAARSLYNLLYEPSPRVGEFCRCVPTGLERLVDRCLQKDRRRRCPNMVEVAGGLEFALQALSKGAQVVRLSGPAVRRRRRVVPRGRGGWIAAAVAALLALLALAGYLRWPRMMEASSVAVIPFTNVRGEAGSEYLSEGLSEGLISSLAELPELKVIARSSSFRFQSAGMDARKVARKLGVRTLVTGSMAETGGSLRISVEIVKGEDGTQIWGRQYQGDRASLAQLQANISRDVAERLRSNLTPAQVERLSKERRLSSQAYEFLLRGRYQMGLYTPESRRNAVNQYQQALAVDPGFAMANAELARAYRLLSGSAIADPNDAMPKANAAARKALAAEPDLAEAHAALGDILKDQWKWAEAERAYRRALELSPSLAVAHQGLAIYLSVAGRVQEAIAQIQRARELSPIGLATNIDTVAVYYNARLYGKALGLLREIGQSDPAAPAVWTWTGIVNGGSGRCAEAVTAFEKAFELGDDTAATRCYYAYSLARSGRAADATRILEEMRQPGRFVPPSGFAIVYAGLNQKERAIQALQQAYASRDPLLQYMAVESHFDGLSGDQRFRSLVAKIGLTR